MENSHKKLFGGIALIILIAIGCIVALLHAGNARQSSRIAGQGAMEGSVNAAPEGREEVATASSSKVSDPTIAPGTTASNSAQHFGIATTSAHAVVSTRAAASVASSESDLMALAGTKYANGEVPLGDYKYVTTAAKKGYIYLCNARKDNPGSMVLGPWVHGATWNLNEKVTVDGQVSWPQAAFSNVISNATRTLSGNALPIDHATGVFPVQASDDAHAYDPNPNTISAQTLKDSLPLNPAYSATPYCMGGEVGTMTDGVPLFNAFDAGLRDAPAHELQDSCDGHPQGSGEYHYHSLSSCFKNPSISKVIGFALDGFPITGPYVTATTYLTTDDLDECHGLTSTVIINGKSVITYHYVMTRDFPYSASCFRGKAVRTGPPTQSQTGTQSTQQTQSTQAPIGQSDTQSGSQTQGG